jgi:hypothetical protein
MKSAVIAKLKELFTDKDVLRAVKEHFDRSWFITIETDHEKRRLRVSLEAEPNNSEVWTVADVALYTHQDRDKILRWCQARARQQAQRAGKKPIPFKKVDGKTLLFSRKEITEWWSRLEPTVFPAFTKGKMRK